MPHFQAIASVIKQSRRGKKIGVFTKDTFTGPFVEGWTSALQEVKVSQVDISAAFAFASAAKDNAEIAIVKVSGVSLVSTIRYMCCGSYRKLVK